MFFSGGPAGLCPPRRERGAHDRRREHEVHESCDADEEHEVNEEPENQEGAEHESVELLEGEHAHE